jgi:pseudaminic acid synthase
MKINIDGFDVGGDSTYIIAELSANHNQDINLAKEMIKAAKDSGADAVKLQTYKPDTITLDVKNDIFKAGDLWSSEYLYDLYARAYMPWEWHEELMEYSKSLDITLFSSPFDFTAVDVLEQIDVPAYKIASFEIVDIPLIKYVASKQKPIIISTGIATLEDIELAIKICHDQGNKDIMLLKCTSSYPAPLEKMNLCMIDDLAKRFDCISGLSDHTTGLEAPILSIAFGAKVIEKHFTHDKSVDTPDKEFSLDPSEFRAMVDSVRKAEKLIGRVDYSLDESKKKSRTYGRSLFISNDINIGDEFTKDNIKSIRPGIGLHPKYYEEILGKKASKEYKKGEPITLDILKEKR